LKHDWGLDQQVEGELAQRLDPELGLELGSWTRIIFGTGRLPGSEGFRQSIFPSLGEASAHPCSKGSFFHPQNTNTLCQTKMTEPNGQNVSDCIRTLSTATPSP